MLIGDPARTRTPRGKCAGLKPAITYQENLFYFLFCFSEKSPRESVRKVSVGCAVIACVCV